jgi:hypothetical protein
MPLLVFQILEMFYNALYCGNEIAIACNEAERDKFVT